MDITESVMLDLCFNSLKDPSDITMLISNIIDVSLALAGFKVIDNGRDYVIVRHPTSGTNYEITAEYLPG